MCVLCIWELCNFSGHTHIRPSSPGDNQIETRWEASGWRTTRMAVGRLLADREAFSLSRFSFWQTLFNAVIYCENEKCVAGNWNRIEDRNGRLRQTEQPLLEGPCRSLAVCTINIKSQAAAAAAFHICSRFPRVGTDANICSNNLQMPPDESAS